MIERLLDVIKWGLIILIGGAVFYFVYPKYDFIQISIFNDEITGLRGNKITGELEELWSGGGDK